MATRSPDRIILYCSKGIVHPSILAKRALCYFFNEIPDTEIIIRNSIHFNKLIQRHAPNLVVLYYHIKHICPSDLAALIDFVNTGGSILAVHSASASFKQDKAYQQLLGGRFINHGAIQDYIITRTNYADEAFTTMPEEITIKDELYLLEFDDDIKVLLETIVENKSEPIAWIKKQGKGKVAYFAPGHRWNVIKDFNIRGIMSELIEWSLCDD